MKDQEMEQKIDEIINKTSQYPDNDDDVLVPQREYREALHEAYSLGQSRMKQRAVELVKKYLNEIDERQHLNDEEKGLVRWGIENVEIRLSALNEL